jgi:hypothetical protein
MLLTACLLICEDVSVLDAATDAEVKAAVQKARRFLIAEATDTTQSDVLVAYTLLKTGTPKDDAYIQGVLKAHQKNFQSGQYGKNLRNQYYTAGVTALLYDALGGETYKTELQMIANYILEGQREVGGWYYPNQGDEKVGDTSITQYALLGLWSAHRAGIEIPEKAWNKAANWLSNTQLPDGGFLYHPNEASRENRSGAKPSLIAAGGSSMALCLRMLYPNGVIEQRIVQKRQQQLQKNYKTYGGILEIVDITEEENQEQISEQKEKLVAISSGELSRKYKASLRLLGSDEELGLNESVWRLYYLYGLERFAAFAAVDKVGDHDWYQTGADFLIKTQAANGSWSGDSNPDVSTCFATLFLYKATAKSIRPPRPDEPTIGSGLLAGGRGLPSDLRGVENKNGKIITKSTDVPVTDLLAQLESSASADLVPLQKAVIEQVQAGQREELIGQTERLLKLLKSPDPEVRSIAVWSLARGNDLQLAPLLIHLIRKDPHFDVAREAYAGLCVLSKKLDGVGLPLNPLQSVAKGTSKEVEARTWRAEAAQRWEDWYLTVRPYKERDDLQDLNKK